MEYQKIMESFAGLAEQWKIRMNGCVIMQGEKILAEKYWTPYDAHTLHRLYSSTKSLVAMAVGRLVGEGKVSLDDKIADYFREELGLGKLHPYLEETTIRDMLLMSTCYSKPTYSQDSRDWLASYFSATPDHPSGTVWNYDSCGSYVLGAMVKRASGLPFDEYLRPVFDAIGISKQAYCLEGPDGEKWAGSAMLATTRDLARAAMLMLKKGNWQGKQLLPYDYCRDAISPLTANNDDANDYFRNCGYGYQIWSLPGGAFFFNGMGAQLAIGYPGRNLVVACTADVQGNPMGKELIFQAIEQEILPHFPVIDEAARDEIMKKPVEKNIMAQINGQKYLLHENPMKISEFTIRQEGDAGVLTYVRDGAQKELRFGLGRDVSVLFPECYSGERLFSKAHEMQYRCSVRGEWLQENKLLIRVYAEDMFVGNMAMCFAFKENQVGVKMTRSAQFFFDEYQGYAGGQKA